ncbi:MAG TPA: outer membrane lipoprotein-sorting protein [Vicinamibacterales bacterium]|nr:outer membrane lipoprotein-sorting protein [Vicinamibacterales bacterium]
MNRHHTWIAAALVCAALVVSRSAEPRVAADTGREIVAEAQHRGASSSERYEGLLQSFDANEKTSEKKWTLERFGSYGESKQVIRFLEPAEVKGVALLVVNHPDRASDQWMWTPAIERDRRIALQDRSTRFFGTDFSFEDLEERDVDQFEYSLLGQETMNGAMCWKIKSIPKEKKSSQYTSSTVWIRQDNYVMARIESYIKDQVVRRLNYTNIRKIQGIWTAQELMMTDLRRSSRTRLALSNIEYNIPISDSRFTLQALRTP